MRIINTEQKEKSILKAVFRLFSLKVIISSVLFVGSLLVFAVIANEAVYENEAAFDKRVFYYFSTFSTPSLIAVMKVFTFFGSGNFLLPAYIVLIGYFFIQRNYRYGLHIAIVALSSTGMMLLIKQITHRHRPELPIIQGITNYSFPSGHALSAFIFCGIFIYIAWNAAISSSLKWLFTILLLFLAVTVGVSRIVLKVHYPTDVIASFCLGIVWATLSLWVMRGISRKNGAQAVPGAGQ